MRRRPQNGLTVIETLIAATLFITSVVVLVGLYPASARAARQSQGHLIAVNIAQRELEFCRGRGYDNAVDYTAEYSIPVENNGARIEIKFNTTVKVTDLAPRGLKSVMVTVDYLAPDHFNRQLKMEGYLGRSAPEAP